MTRFFVSGAVLAFALSAGCYADGFFLRPAFGPGIQSGAGGGRCGAGYFAGGRVLLSSNDYQRYGLECSFLDAHALRGRRDNSAVCAGIVIEQVLAGSFHMGIGTVGYFYRRTAESPAGICATLGWEPSVGARVRPLAAYRTDCIIKNGKVRVMNSIMLGTGVSL